MCFFSITCLFFLDVFKNLFFFVRMFEIGDFCFGGEIWDD